MFLFFFFSQRGHVIRAKRIASESCDTPNHLVGSTPRTRNCVRLFVGSFDLSPLVPSSGTRITQPFRPWDPRFVRSLARSLAALVSGPTFPFLLQRDSHHFRGPLVLCLSRSVLPRVSVSQSRSTKTHLRMLTTLLYNISRYNFDNIVLYMLRNTNCITRYNLRRGR